MTNQSDVSVKLDDRFRLMSAMLAATDWPDKAQARKPHGTHAHARATRKQLAGFRSHEAVHILQSMLDKNAPLEAMFALMTRVTWPEMRTETMPSWVPQRWPDLMLDFYQRADLANWWKKESFVWDKSLSEAGKMFGQVQFRPFLAQFLGAIHEGLIFVPNIVYPSDQEIGIRQGRDLVCIAPPRLAWGDSPPWPFDEDPVHIYRAALTQYGRLLLGTYLHNHQERLNEAKQTALPVSEQYQTQVPKWEDQFTNLFTSGMVAIYLEDHVNQAEANAFVLMERKVHGMALLPGVVSVLRRYLSEMDAGRYTGLADFLPLFPKQLRIAKRIVSL